MEEIVHAFGLDGRLIVIQMFNFGLLVLALWYFLYTPILKILSEREAKLKQGVEDAEMAQRAKEEAGKEKELVLKEARIEAEAIVESAKTHAEVKGTDIVRDAEARALRMLEDTKERCDEERVLSRKASEAEIAEAAILAAEAILKGK